MTERQGRCIWCDAPFSYAYRGGRERLYCSPEHKRSGKSSDRQSQRQRAAQPPDAYTLNQRPESLSVDDGAQLVGAWQAWRDYRNAHGARPTSGPVNDDGTHDDPDTPTASEDLADEWVGQGNPFVEYGGAWGMDDYWDLDEYGFRFIRCTPEQRSDIEHWHHKHKMPLHGLYTGETPRTRLYIIGQHDRPFYWCRRFVGM